MEQPEGPPSDPSDPSDPSRLERERVVRLVEEVASLEARVAALHAEQVGALADLLGNGFVEDADVDLVDELAPRLRWTTFTATRRMSTAGRVVHCFPLLLEDLAGGELDYHRVDVVVREAELLDEEQSLVLDAVIAGRLPGLTTSQIKDLVRREIAMIDSDAVKERARRVVTGRRVGYTALADGEGLLQVLGPAPALRAVFDRLDALAKDPTRPGADVDPYADHPAVARFRSVLDGTTPERRTSGGSAPDAPTLVAPTPDAPTVDAPAADARGIDAKRFDAGVEMLLAPVPGAAGVASGTGPHITVAWPAALGLDDQPAHLAGHGPLPAELVRHLLRHHGFRNAATHPLTGHLAAVDDHIHPAGSLPDLTLSADRARWGAVSAARAQSSAAVTDRATTDPAPDPASNITSNPASNLASNLALGSAAGLGPCAPQERSAAHEGYRGAVGDGPAAPDRSSALVDADGDTSDTNDAGHDAGDLSSGRQPCGEDQTFPARRYLTGGSPPEIPEALDLADPGAGWSDELQGFDDGIDRTWDGDVPGEWEQTDPALGPREDEFTVTADISRLRPATLVNPHRVHDLADWRRLAGRRALSAVARCPVAADTQQPYRFGAALRRFLMQRSPTCAAPGCRAPAHRCDIDHTVDHARGGPTCACNASPLCRRHHTAKHGAGWCVVRAGDDPRDPALTWLSPLGYLYTVAPSPLLPPTSPLVAEHLARRHRAREAHEAQLADRRAEQAAAADRTATTEHAPAGEQASLAEQAAAADRASDGDRKAMAHRPASQGRVASQARAVGADRVAGPYEAGRVTPERTYADDTHPPDASAASSPAEDAVAPSPAGYADDPPY